MGEIPQEATPSACALEDGLSVAVAANFQDERAVEMEIVEVREQGRPVDGAIARSEMVVVLMFVIACMHHP